MANIYIVVVLLGLCVGGASGIVNIDPEKKEKIDNFANSLLFDCDKHSNIVGMNLAIVYEGEVLYTTGYGVKNLDTQEPVTEDTVYNIASLSKHFTTTLLGQILSNSGYSWDAKVHDILADLGTEFYFYDPLRSNLTSLRDLGSHFSGIPIHDRLWATQNMSRSEEVSRLRFLEGAEEPRTSFKYNNLMYMLMGYVTEQLAGTKWEQLIQTECFDKVGMVNSSFIYSVDGESADLATPYMRFEGEPREVAWQAFSDMGEDVGPAGGITSTANDMARWMNMLLAGGLNEAGEEVFSSDVIFETRTPVNAYISEGNPQYYPPEFPVSYSYWSTYGLGLSQGSYRGYRLLAHTGFLWGHFSLYTLFPDINLGIYTSINGQEGFPSAMEHIALYTADIVLDQEPWLNTTTACIFPFASSSLVQNKKKDEVDVSVTAGFNAKQIKPEYTEIDQFLGQYGNFGYANLTVVVDDMLEELIVNFDVYSCVVRNVTGERQNCVGIEPLWFISLWRIQFDEENNPSQFVDMTFTLGEDPVRFERDLLFEDAPGPRDHWPQCDEVFPGHNS